MKDLSLFCKTILIGKNHELLCKFHLQTGVTVCSSYQCWWSATWCFAMGSMRWSVGWQKRSWRRKRHFWMKRRSWELVSLPETNSSPLKRYLFLRGNSSFQTSMFRGYVKLWGCKCWIEKSMLIVFYVGFAFTGGFYVEWSTWQFCMVHPANYITGVIHQRLIFQAIKLACETSELVWT